MQPAGATDAAAPTFIRVSTSLTPTLHEWLSERAAEQGVGLSTAIRLIIVEKRRAASGPREVSQP